MKFAALAIVITAIVVSLIWGGVNLGGAVGNTLVALGVLTIVVALMLGVLLYRGLQT
jgi:hypothetical protein